MKDILLDEEIVTAEQLGEAEKVAEKKDVSLVQVLIDKGLINEVTLASILAKQRGLPFVDLTEYQIDANAVVTISEDMARRYTVLPLGFEGNKLVVAMADPANIFAIDDLRIVTGYDIKPVVATESDLLAVVGHCFRMGEAVEEEIEKAAEGEVGLEKIREVAAEAPIVKLVNLIITRAIRDRASDIHIEPQERDLRVRYRIDGVLHEVMRSPKRIQPALLSRFKVMAGMDIAEHRRPQDGHCALTVGGKAYDFRVATLPTVYGERVVLRILEKESILFKLEDLGFLPESLERFKFSFTKPYGAILITGPTGSGKSTTLYATLNVLNVAEKNIVTIEDPVEYRLPGINQIQINTKAGLTFARGLRSILRAAPDIIMVGEIRDRETAQIAIEAALTGHLVFSTLHTNDAPGAITRLTEMGIPPFLTASAVDCVQAQRLARRLCKECKEAYEPSPEMLERVGFSFDGKVPTLYKVKGCKKCNNTGYKGRIGIYEIMMVSETVERLTVERATAEQIKEVAIAEGMKTLREDGLEKVRLGITSLEEILRVVV
ncbi:MAG TPA: type II secretion system protein GspE [Actinobacteria bacterium]|nr:type II secretion system protein GspE [Actinomycetota bacterium]